MMIQAKMTGPLHHWGTGCKYNIMHDIRDIKRAKAEWIIKALHDANTRLPRSPFNHERRILIRAAMLKLEQQASNEFDFSVISSRCSSKPMTHRKT